MALAPVKADNGTLYREALRLLGENIAASRTKIDAYAKKTADSVQAEKARIEKFAPEPEGAWSIANRGNPVDGRRVDLRGGVDVFA